MYVVHGKVQIQHQSFILLCVTIVTIHQVRQRIIDVSEHFRSGIFVHITSDYMYFKMNKLI